MFSLFIDRIGYKVAMVFSFVSYLVYTAHGVRGLQRHSRRDRRCAARRASSTATNCFTGAASFSASATAAWRPTPIPSSPRCSTRTKPNGSTACTPAGRADWCSADFAPSRWPSNADWRITLGLILIPAFIFFFILIGLKFPKSEREQAGVSYLAMLKELGAFGALVGFGLVFAQLGQVFGWSNGVVWGLDRRRGV